MCWPTSRRRPVPSEDVARPLKALAKQAASGSKRRRRKLEQAWKEFRKAGCFWRD